MGMSAARSEKIFLMTGNIGQQFYVQGSSSQSSVSRFTYRVHGRTSSQAFFAAAQVTQAPEIRERLRLVLFIPSADWHALDPFENCIPIKVAAG
jgi:hypothetical protein